MRRWIYRPDRPPIVVAGSLSNPVQKIFSCINRYADVQFRRNRYSVVFLFHIAAMSRGKATFMTHVHSYLKIWNMGHPALTGLLLDEVIVEEKADGSEWYKGKRLEQQIAATGKGGEA